MSPVSGSTASAYLRAFDKRLDYYFKCNEEIYSFVWYSVVILPPHRLFYCENKQVNLFCEKNNQIFAKFWKLLSYL